MAAGYDTRQASPHHPKFSFCVQWHRVIGDQTVPLCLGSLLPLISKALSDCAIYLSLTMTALSYVSIPDIWGKGVWHSSLPFTKYSRLLNPMNRRTSQPLVVLTSELK